MKRKNNSWIHMVLIAVIAFLPMSALTANADISAAATSVSVNQVDLHEAEHQDCNMDTSCMTDCQTGTTHCSSSSLVIISSGHSATLLTPYHPSVVNAEHLQSVSNRNLFRPPRNIA